MKFRINTKGNAYGLLIFIVIFCWHNFYGLFKKTELVEDLLRYDNLTPIIAFIGAVVMIWFVIARKSFYRRHKKLTSYYIMLSIYMIVEIFYSILKYGNQSLFTTFKVASTFAIATFAVPVVFYLERRKNAGSLINAINIFSLAWNLLLITQIAYYKATGSFYLDFWSYFLLYFNQGSYGFRISMHVFGVPMLIYNTVCLKYSNMWKRKIFHFFATVVGIYCLIFIQQGRSSILYYCLTIATVLFLYSDKSRNSRILQMLAIVAIGAVFAFTDIVPSFFKSFSVSGNRAYSTTARLYAIDYYRGRILNNPLLGNGFADSGANSPYYNVEHGALGMAFYSDVGVVGLLAFGGLAGLMMTYIIPLVRMMKVWMAHHKQLSRGMECFSLAFLVYLVVSLPTSTIIVNAGRSLLLMPIAIALFEYLDSIQTLDKQKKHVGSKNLISNYIA